MAASIALRRSDIKSMGLLISIGDHSTRSRPARVAKLSLKSNPIKSLIKRTFLFYDYIFKSTRNASYWLLFSDQVHIFFFKICCIPKKLSKIYLWIMTNRWLNEWQKLIIKLWILCISVFIGSDHQHWLKICCSVELASCVIYSINTCNCCVHFFMCFYLLVRRLLLCDF